MSRNYPDTPPDDVEWCAHLVGPPKTGDKHKDYLWDVRALMFNAIRYSIYYTEGSGSAALEGRDRDKENDRAFWAQAMDHHNREHPYEVACVRAVMAGLPIPPAPQTRGQPSPQTITQAGRGEEEEWRREEEEWRRKDEYEEREERNEDERNGD